MSLTLYMDVHIPKAITDGLRVHGVDVLTAQEDGAARLPDSALLDRATTLGRVLFSQDKDLLREAVRRHNAHESFAGIIFAHQLKITIGQCIRDLDLIAQTSEPADLVNQVEYLPLR